MKNLIKISFILLSFLLFLNNCSLMNPSDTDTATADDMDGNAGFVVTEINNMGISSLEALNQNNFAKTAKTITTG